MVTTNWKIGWVPWGEPIKGATICILIVGIAANDELYKPMIIFNVPLSKKLALKFLKVGSEDECLKNK
jgi:hypothetical protein